MNPRTLLVICVLMFVGAQGGVLNIAVLNPPGSTPVGSYTNWIFLAATAMPNSSVTITLAPTGAALSATSLVLNTQTQQASFRIQPTSLGSVSVTMTLSDATNFALLTSVVTVNSIQRTLSFGASPVNNLQVDVPSQYFSVSLSMPSSSPLTITPSATSTATGAAVVTFMPASQTIPAGAVTTTFQMLASSIFSTSANVVFGLSGSEASFYGNASSVATFTSSARTVYLSEVTTTDSAPVGASTNNFYVYTTDLPNNTLTFTITATDTTSKTITLDKSSTIQPFTFTSSSVQSGKPVYYFLSGPGAVDYTFSNGLSTVVGGFSSNLRPFVVDVPTNYIMGQTASMSIRLLAPPVQSVTVTLNSGLLSFTPSSVTFTGQTMLQVFSVTPVGLGSDVINYQVSTVGQQYDYYAQIPTKSINVVLGTISMWNFPTNLYLGATSDPINIRANVPTATNVAGVSVTPICTDAVANPSTILLSTSAGVQQTFTLTPSISGNALGSAQTVTCTYVLTGADASIFTAPTSNTVAINRKSVEINYASAYELPSSTLYLGKPYIFWAYCERPIGSSESVVVTPVSPYYTFSPSSVTLSSNNPYVQFSVIPTAVGSSLAIGYVLSGSSASNFSSPSPNSFSIAPRNILIYEIFESFDSRENGYVLAVNPPSYTASIGASDLIKNHVKSIAFYSMIAPTTSLTITPVSNAMTFSPSSVTVTANNLQTVDWLTYVYNQAGNPLGPQGGTPVSVPIQVAMFNFTVNPQVNGLHFLRLQLSGTDSPYYATPGDIRLNFNLGKNSSGRLASSLTFILLAALALVFVM